MADEERCKAVRPVKNLLVLCTTIMLLYTGFYSFISLIVNANIGKEYGRIWPIILKGSVIVSSLFLAPLIIRKLGTKWTMVIGVILFAPFIAASFYPSWGTIAPAAILCGIFSGAIWTSVGVYIVQIATIYAMHKEKKPKDTIFIFFGAMLTFYQTSKIFAKVLSYTVLTTDYMLNITYVHCSSCPTCGIHFCDFNYNKTVAKNTTRFQETNKTTKFYTVVGVMSVLIVSAVFVLLFFLQKISVPTRNIGILKLSIQPTLCLKKLYHILLLPINCFSEMQLSFFLSDFAKAFIACNYGIHYIDSILIWFGIANTVALILGSILTPYVHRAIFVYMATAMYIGATIGMWFWVPSGSNFPTLYVFSAFFGICDSVWQVNTIALYGFLFQENKVDAFALYTALQAIGEVIISSISNKICTLEKICILFVFLVLGVLGYTAVEIHYWKTNLNIETNVKEKE